MGRVDAQPAASTITLKPGRHRLGLREHRDGVLQVPTDASNGPVPLLALLHGAGGSASSLLEFLSTQSVASRAVILATDSEGTTWDLLTPDRRSVLDVVGGSRRSMGFGADVSFLDQALTHVFQKVAIDPTRIAIGGFSDGATYALSLGLVNGDLFRRIVAFSPGFIATGERRGRPDIFITHGERDNVLPITRTSRRITRDLKASGYSVAYREFDGGHTVPDTIAREGLEWAIALR
jgi:phospholipase/carboxylesterase